MTMGLTMSGLWFSAVSHGQAVVVNRTVQKLGDVFKSTDEVDEANLNEDVEIFDMANGQGGKDDKAQGFSSSVVASVSRSRASLAHSPFH